MYISKLQTVVVAAVVAVVVVVVVVVDHEVGICDLPDVRGFQKTLWHVYTRIGPPKRMPDPRLYSPSTY